MIDNSNLIEPFVPETADGDTFIYTELLNRERKSGNNKGRLVRTFYHRSREEFRAQMPDIRAWCEWTGARAYTRLSSRSFKKVGHLFAKHVVEQALAENWEGMRHGYSHCCGISAPLEKYWLWDVDDPTDLEATERGMPSYAPRVTIPSKKGFHVITVPFDIRQAPTVPTNVQLHKDNPTNLYIP